MSIQGGALGWVLVVGVGLVGCGGSSSTGTAAPRTASPNPSGPGALTDSGLTTDAGTPAAPPLLPDGGASAGADCEGLAVTTTGVPASFTTPRQPRGWACAASTGEGGGNVALVTENGYQPHQSDVFVVTAAGALSGTSTGTRLRPTGQAAGFEGADVYGAFSQHDLVNLSVTGVLVHKTHAGTGGALQANNPVGGVVLVSSMAGASTGTVESYDESGALRWQQTLRQGPCLGVGVDRAGNTLVLLDGAAGAGTLAGVWLDGAGNAQAPFEVLPAFGRPVDFELVPQVGSGLFLQQTDYGSGSASARWVAALSTLTSSGSPAPAWLAARPNTDLRIARGGRGYASLPLPGASTPDCHQDLEVLSASGARCSVTRLTAGPAACSTGVLEVGYDGTILQPLPPGAGACDANGQCVCAWQWFPGLLK